MQKEFTPNVAMREKMMAVNEKLRDMMDPESFRVTREMIIKSLSHIVIVNSQDRQQDFQSRKIELVYINATTGAARR